MDEPKTRAPHHDLTDVARQMFAEQRAAASDSALGRALRQVRLDAAAGSERQVVSAFNSAL